MLEEYIIFSSLLFAIGIFGILYNRKSMISVLISVEIMLLAVNLNFVAFSAFSDRGLGIVFALFVLAIAAAEMAIGLAILMVYFKNRGNILLSPAILLGDE